MFIPSKFKFKKHQKGKAFNLIKSDTNNFQFGQIALKSITFTRLSSKQIITFYNFIKKKLKKKGKLLIRIFPQTSVSKKPIEVRMGKGKGAFNFWASKTSSGVILCEVATFYLSFAYKVLNAARFRLPLKTKIIIRKI
jgi:large subunit ribosomal protein L16